MSASQWRIDLAENISTYYSAEAILLVGSPVFGLADAYSDVDMVMFWETIPSDHERIEIAEKIGRLHVLDSFNNSAEFSLQDAAEVLYVGENNLKIDITHKTVVAQSKMIEEVVTSLDSNPKKLAHIRSLSQSVTLKGDALLKKWQEFYQPIPRKLAEKLLADHLHFWAFNRYKNS